MGQEERNVRKTQTQHLLMKSISGRALDHLYVSSPVVLKWSEAVREKDTLAPTASSRGRLPELLWDTLPLIP